MSQILEILNMHDFIQSSPCFWKAGTIVLSILEMKVVTLGAVKLTVSY